jgi:RNA polymerase sigma-70 factor (ECF subfamily)
MVAHTGQPSYGIDPLGEAVSHEEFSLFCEAVRMLPAQCRRAFVLKKVYGYSRKEIAEHLNVSENTVQTQIARGMKASLQFMDQRERDGKSNKVMELNAGRLRTSKDDLG